MLWGGRFKDKISDDALRFTSSLQDDIFLFYEDITCSLAHCDMLKKTGLISDNECESISSGLKLIQQSYTDETWIPSSTEYEDIHSAIEARLKEIIGTTAEKLHTGRSRNDQVATDMRLWIKRVLKDLQSNIVSFQRTLIKISSEHINTIMPGYTHLQRAQPVSLAFHLLAYVEMLERDKARFDFVFEESNICPLGSGALAGSTLPLDNFYTSERLHFNSPSPNALDAVSDRDFLLDFLNGVSIGMMHLSRMAEELILWSTSEWNFIKFADQYSTGSSLMPQKKNPDIAELIRGKTGRIYGNYLALATTLKGLPLSYNRDMQEDKGPVYESFSIYNSSLLIIEKVVSSLKFNESRFLAELKKDFILATDVADWLVLKDIPFRSAHKIVGELVSYCEGKSISFDELTLAELKNFNEMFDESVFECFDLKSSLNRKQTFGSPNPMLIQEQISIWNKKLSS